MHISFFTKQTKVKLFQTLNYAIVSAARRLRAWSMILAVRPVSFRFGEASKPACRALQSVLLEELRSSNPIGQVELFLSRNQALPLPDKKQILKGCVEAWRMIAHLQRCRDGVDGVLVNELQASNQVLRSDCPSDLPSGRTERLSSAPDRHRSIPHSRKCRCKCAGAIKPHENRMRMFLNDRETRDIPILIILLSG